jgi:putative ABC transport system permease protein
MNADHAVGMETIIVDEEYFRMMGVTFADGRNFDAALSTEKQNYILNEEAIRRMGIINPVGQEFSLNGKWGKIVGVIKDTYFQNLHTKIVPQVFHLYGDMEKESSHSVLFLKISDTDVTGTMSGVQKIWSRYNPGILFEYSFLESEYEKLYQSDLQIARLINVFALLAVFIACLGLFGQSIFTAENRTKEIGIHKVNGARVLDVLILLNRNFVRWITIAFGFALPVAWFFMNKWLQNFAYKTELSWWIFALAGILALVIALLTVSWQSWRAATRNPVEALRYE